MQFFYTVCVLCVAMVDKTMADSAAHWKDHLTKGSVPQLRAPCSNFVIIGLRTRCCRHASKIINNHSRAETTLNLTLDIFCKLIRSKLLLIIPENGRCLSLINICKNYSIYFLYKKSGVYIVPKNFIFFPIPII